MRRQSIQNRKHLTRALLDPTREGRAFEFARAVAVADEDFGFVEMNHFPTGRDIDAANRRAVGHNRKRDLHQAVIRRRKAVVEQRTQLALEGVFIGLFVREDAASPSAQFSSQGSQVTLN